MLKSLLEASTLYRRTEAAEMGIFPVTHYGAKGSSEAIAEANAAAHAGGGTVFFPPWVQHTIDSSTGTINVTSPAVSWMGAGIGGASVINCDVNGDNVWWHQGPFASPGDGYISQTSGTISGLCFQGGGSPNAASSNANAVGLHYGDALNGTFEKLFFRGFNGLGGIGIHLDNLTTWTEGMIWNQVLVEFCTICVMFDMNNGGSGPGQNSYDYNRIYGLRTVTQGVNNVPSIGVLFRNGAVYARGEFHHYNNCSTGTYTTAVHGQTANTFMLIEGLGITDPATQGNNSGFVESFVVLQAEIGGNTSYGQPAGIVTTNKGQFQVNSGYICEALAAQGSGSWPAQAWFNNNFYSNNLGTPTGIVGNPPSLVNAGLALQGNTSGVTVVGSNPVIFTPDSSGLFLAGATQSGNAPGYIVLRPNIGSGAGSVTLDKNGDLYLPGLSRSLRATQTASYALTVSDDTVYFNITAAATATLLAANAASYYSSGSGKHVIIGNKATSTANLTLASAGGTVPLTVIPPGMTVEVKSDSTNWLLVSASFPNPVALGGDLGGSGSAPQVESIQGTAISAPPGGTSQFLAGNGTWQIPAGGASSTVTPYMMGVR